MSHRILECLRREHRLRVDRDDAPSLGPAIDVGVDLVGGEVAC